MIIKIEVGRMALGEGLVVGCLLEQRRPEVGLDDVGELFWR